MSRNELIEEAGRLGDVARALVNVQPDWRGWLISQLSACHGELNHFANDLCNAPTLHNREIGAVAYTVRSAHRRLIELRTRLEVLQKEAA